jgi:hypothetical protein
MFVLTDSDNINYGLFETEQEAFAEISKQLQIRDFQSYYMRQSFLEEGTIWIDYGSHTHFFYIKVFYPLSFCDL